MREKTGIAVVIGLRRSASLRNLAGNQFHLAEFQLRCSRQDEHPFSNDRNHHALGVTLTLSSPLSNADATRVNVRHELREEVGELRSLGLGLWREHDRLPFDVEQFMSTYAKWNEGWSPTNSHTHTDCPRVRLTPDLQLARVSHLHLRHAIVEIDLSAPADRSAGLNGLERGVPEDECEAVGGRVVRADVDKRAVGGLAGALQGSAHPLHSSGVIPCLIPSQSSFRPVVSRVCPARVKFAQPVLFEKRDGFGSDPVCK